VISEYDTVIVGIDLVFDECSRICEIRIIGNSIIGKQKLGII